ncbi:LPXTG cell wall anchor domain-containing protein, partial [Agromyces sp. NPDC060279]|uniref:LPXTG cell wall anchor domain-containing protein n=1 Tax=Agromyces sp. NPDC060279 TaxID=3347092 RepID=UPI00366932D3
SGELVAGEVVTYSFLVTNTGNVTLTDITVEEGEFTGAGEVSGIDCPAGAGSLAPRESVTCTASYRVVEADLTGRAIANEAVGLGTAPGSPAPITSDASAVEVGTVLPAPPSATLPSTGAGAVPALLTIAGALLLGGAVVLTGMRRRRTLR